MKKILLLLASVALLVSCNSLQSQKPSKEVQYSSNPIVEAGMPTLRGLFMMTHTGSFLHTPIIMKTKFYLMHFLRQTW